MGVPTKVWKVVYNHTTGETIAFIFPNQKFKANQIPEFVVTVDEVEKATGINFFPKLAESAEAKFDKSKWPEIFK